MFQMKFEDANEYRAFCRNELSATIDGDGGVVSLDWIDCYYHHDGTVYPDEIKLPIFSRDHASEKTYPAYGAAVQLYTRETTRRVLLHRPCDPSFTLSYLQGGDAEQTYELLLDNGRVLWECGCTTANRDELLFCVNNRFLFDGNSKATKEQHSGPRSTQKGDHFEEAGIPLPTDIPKLNGPAKITWTAAGYDEENAVLLFSCTAEYVYGTVAYVLACGLNVETTSDTAPGMTVLRAKWGDNKTIRAGMALAHTVDEAILSLKAGLAEFDALRDAQRNEEKARHTVANVVKTEALPFTEEYSKATAAYLDSLMVGPMDKGRIGVRASANVYGYFSVWDTIFPLRDFLWNGRFADAERMLEYLFRLPAMENTPVASVHLITAWNEAMAFLPTDALGDIYPIMRRIFEFECRLVEPQYGLLQCKGNTGVDDATQMGLYGMFLSPDVNGMWYNACCAMHNEALRQGDAETAKRAYELIKGIEKGFRKAFFNEDVGYFRGGVNTDLTPAEFDVYHNTLTLGYDYAFGPYLMRDSAAALAHYQSHELWHPLGHRAVAFDSAMPCSWWRYVHMNQHNGHEMKLQRAADNMAEVYRVMGQTMKRSERWKNAEETTNFSRFAIHPDQVCDWQAFAATAQMEALRSAVAGIGRHRGGLYYAPATDNRDVTVENVPMGDARISVTVTGDGSFATLVCGGKAVTGTLQQPCDVPAGDLCIRRGEASAYPVLLNVVDMPVANVTVQGTSTACECQATAYAPMIWYAPAKPTVTVNGEVISCEWDEQTKRVYFSRVWQANDHVLVAI